jgi:hypothetical protein
VTINQYNVLAHQKEKKMYEHGSLAEGKGTEQLTTLSK